MSLAYQLLNIPPDNFQLPTLEAWERDLQCTLTSKQKQNILHFTFKSSICTKTQETNYKLLTRWYNTPAKFQKFFPSSSGLCWRCGEESGTILHVFWSFPRLEQFWKSIQQTIQRFTERPVSADPAFFLLHATTMSSKTYKKSLIRHLLDAAKACIPLLWKSTGTPSMGMWLRKVEDVRKMEDLILTARNQKELYDKTWTTWMLYIFSDEGRNLLSDSGNTVVG